MLKRNGHGQGEQLSFLEYLDALAGKSGAAGNGRHNGAAHNGNGHNGHAGNGHAPQNGTSTVLSEVPPCDVDVDKLDRFRGVAAIVGRYRKMSRDEEYRLVALAQSGCLRSRDRLIVHNLGFILSALSKAFPGREGLSLLGAGCLGMDEAIKRFKRDKGLRLISYAVHWIRAAVQRDKESAPQIRLPSDWRTKRASIHAEMAVTGKDYYSAAESAGIGHEVARAMDVSPAMASPASMDKRIGDEDGSATLGDLLASDAPRADDAVVREEIRRDVRRVVWTLPQAQREVIAMRFGFRDTAAGKGKGKDGRLETLQDVGDALGLTRERVRQVERDALAILHKRMRRAGMDKSLIEAF